MFLPYKYTYFFGTLLFLIFWIFLYWARKDLRKEMLFMSFGLAFVGLLPEYYLWTHDWWRPLTITNTKIGIEDFLLGFTNGGIAAVLYEVIFKRRLYKRDASAPNYRGVLAFIIVSLVILIYSFYFLHLTSFKSTIWSLLMGGLVIVILRKDLFRDAIISGLLTALIFLPIYWISSYLSPGVIQKTWLMNNLSGIFLLGVPLEDVVFYFLTGFTIGPMYEFWQQDRLRRISGQGSLFKFSIKNYHLLASVFLFYPLIKGIFDHSWFPLTIFITFALAGVIGETLFAIWWHSFYEKRFWIYRVETLMHSYTSLLNFIPWGVGGMLYMNILNFITPFFPKTQTFFSITGSVAALPFYVIFSVSFLAGLATQLLIWIFVFLYRGHFYKFRTVTLGNYLFFNFPFLLALSVCTLLYGRQFLVIAFAFAIVAAAAEYLFGKTVEFLISKKLWIYSYEALDNGHFTPLSLMPFSLGGFYFWSIFLIFQSFPNLF